MSELTHYGLVPNKRSDTKTKPGEKYGRLTVLAVGRKADGQRKTFAVCQCDCGGPPSVHRTDQLTAGKTTSCGCYHLEQITKHGLWDHPLYPVWQRMMARCYHTQNPRYDAYGGRGITVESRWHNVETFVADMGKTFFPGAEIERYDNDRGYCRSNCGWATHAAQARNKRTNINLTYKGKTQCLAEWARETGINYDTLITRVKVLGWPAERVLTTPALTGAEALRIARGKRWGHENPQ